MTVVNTPVPVSVTSRVVRIQPLQTDFQIINTDLNATVWAANNASITPGQGTPIPSGTSLTWTAPGDVYLILGNDTLSVLAGSAAVIISYDVADWSPSPAAIAAAVLNSGVLVIDRPVVLINDTNFNGTSALIDVSRYNSVDCVFDSNGFPGPFSVEVNWYADAAATQRVFSTTVFLNEGPTQWAGAMPCRGAYLQIVEIGAGGMTIRIFSSNRTIETIRNSLVLAAFDNNLLLDVSQAGIASGASGTIRFTVQPYFGEVEIYAAFGGAAVTAAGTRYVVGLGGANNRNIALDGTGGSSALQNNNNIVNVQRMAVWGKQLHFQPVNTSAGIATMSVMVTPISQQPA